MSLRRWHEGSPYYFAARSTLHGLVTAPATYAGHPIGWGDDGVAPHPEYPVRVVARKDEPLAFTLQGRVLKSESEAVAFVQRCRNNCVLLDARDRLVGTVFRLPQETSWSRHILLRRENENAHA